jgi:hypothetical protein
MDLLQHSTICKGCWQNLHLPVVLRGPLAIPFRVVGLRPSRMNPNTCTFCELAFTRIMKARNVTIDATVLFVDLRGYTTASESLASSEMASTLDAFYDEMQTSDSIEPKSRKCSQCGKPRVYWPIPISLQFGDRANARLRCRLP